MTTELVRGSAVYIDANVFIYFVERTPDFFDKARALFTALAEGEARVLTSELTVAECLFHPARNGNIRLVSVYERFFDPEGDVRLIPLTGAVAKQAAQAGGSWGLKLLDAIHYVSALESGCTAFVTADSRFRSGPALKVVRV